MDHYEPHREPSQEKVKREGSQTPNPNPKHRKSEEKRVAETTIAMGFIKTVIKQGNGRIPQRGQNVTGEPLG